MTQKRRATPWLDKPLRRIEALLHREDFKKDIELLPQDHADEEFLSGLLHLCDKYDLPSNEVLILHTYILTGDLSPNPSASRLAVISDTDGTLGPSDNTKLENFLYTAHRGFPPKGVEIFIPPGTSSTELKSFINDNWEYIEQKIGKERKVRRSPMARRDAEVKRLKNEGLTHKQIADHINSNLRFEDATITYTDIPRILRKKK